jgi:hypothetical protein
MDVVRIIASKLIDRRPLLEAVQMYSAVSMTSRSMSTFRDALAERLAADHLVMHPCSRPDIPVPAPHPFPDGIHSVKAVSIRDHLRRLGLKVSGAKAVMFARACDHFSALPLVTVRPNIVPMALRDALACDPAVRITVTEAKSTYRLSEQHLVGLDEVMKTNPVRRSGHPMRLYLKREVMLAQWAKDDTKLREKAGRALDRAINGPRPRPPPAPKTPSQLARMARKECKAELTALLERRGLELRSDSRMCEEYVQYGGNVIRVVEMMEEMEFFVEHTQYSSIFSDIVDEFERRRSQQYCDRDMWEYRERWDRDDVSHQAKRKALRAYMRRGGAINDVPPHLRAEAQAL